MNRELTIEDFFVKRIPWNKGKRWSQEIKDKMSKSAIGKHSQPKSEKWKKEQSLRLKGRTLNESWRKKLSDYFKGKSISEEHKKNIILGAEKTRYKKKIYSLPTGEIINVQGYEPWTLDKLIKEENVPIEYIKFRSPDKPIIKYNNKHWYIPDCYLSNTNTIVETKSTWTWERQLEENLNKINACQNQGYNVRIIIWDNKRNLIQDKIYERY